MRKSDYIVHFMLGLSVGYTFAKALKQNNTFIIIMLTILCVISVILFVLKLRKLNKEIRELEGKLGE